MDRQFCLSSPGLLVLFFDTLGISGFFKTEASSAFKPLPQTRHFRCHTTEPSDSSVSADGPCSYFPGYDDIPQKTQLSWCSHAPSLGSCPWRSHSRTPLLSLQPPGVHKHPNTITGFTRNGETPPSPAPFHLQRYPTQQLVVCWQRVALPSHPHNGYGIGGLFVWI